MKTVFGLVVVSAAVCLILWIEGFDIWWILSLRDPKAILLTIPLIIVTISSGTFYGVRLKLGLASELDAGDLNGMLIAPILEELIFRLLLNIIIVSVLMIVLPLLTSIVSAIAITSVLFGLSHSNGGWQKVVISTFAGVIMSLAFLAGGLVASFLVHSLHNTFMAFFVKVYPLTGK